MLRRLTRRWRHLNRYEKKRRRRQTFLVGGIVVVVLVLVGLFSGWQHVSSARESLDDARATLDQLTANPNQILTKSGRATTTRELDQVAVDVAAANHQLRSSLSVDALWFVPYLHTQRQGILDLVDDVAATTDSGQRLLASLDTLAARSHGTSISLPDLKHMLATVQAAHTLQAGLIRSSSGLYSSLAAARQDFNRDDLRLTAELAQGAQLLSYALPFLGADGPRTYLLAAENNAEMRENGAVLSYALIHTDGGSYTVDDARPIGDITLAAPVDVPMSAGMSQFFGKYGSTQLWQNADATADFSWSGHDMAAMYAAATGVHVDGVIGMDVPMLSQLLSLTGPVNVPGIAEPVNAANVGVLLLHQLYQGESPGPQVERNDELAAVAKGVVAQLRAGDVDLATFVDTLVKAAAGRHLMAWDSVQSYERVITRFGGSGGIDTDQPTRSFHVAVENATATKLDFYVRVAISMHVTVTTLGNAVVTTQVTVTNDAPAGAAPSYQLGPDDVSSFVPGQYVGHVYLWGPRDDVQPGGTSEDGLTLSELDLSVLPQQQASVSFYSEIPDAVVHNHLDLVLVPQARLVPETYAVSLTAPDWNIYGPATITGSVARTENLTWGLTG